MSCYYISVYCGLLLLVKPVAPKVLVRILHQHIAQQYECQQVRYGHQWEFPKETAIGALGLYVSDESITEFQPMNVNFSIIAPLEKRIRKKAEKNLAIAQRSLAIIDELLARGF